MSTINKIQIVTNGAAGESYDIGGKAENIAYDTTTVKAKIESLESSVNSCVKTGTSNVVTTAMINDSAITEAKINNGAVTNDKLASGISGSKITDGTITDSQISTTASINAKKVNYDNNFSVFRKIENLDYIANELNTTTIPGIDTSINNIKTKLVVDNPVANLQIGYGDYKIAGNKWVLDAGAVGIATNSNYKLVTAIYGTDFVDGFPKTVTGSVTTLRIWFVDKKGTIRIPPIVSTANSIDIQYGNNNTIFITSSGGGTIGDYYGVALLFHN